MCSLKSTIEYLGEWEMLYNPNFNCTEFDTIRNTFLADDDFIRFFCARIKIIRNFVAERATKQAYWSRFNLGEGA